MAFIWSSIHKLKPRVLNHSLVCYKSLHFKTAFDQKASTNWFLQLGEIAISHFSTSDRKEAEKMHFKMFMVWLMIYYQWFNSCDCQKWRGIPRIQRKKHRTYQVPYLFSLHLLTQKKKEMSITFRMDILKQGAYPRWKIKYLWLHLLRLHCVCVYTL